MQEKLSKVWAPIACLVLVVIAVELGMLLMPTAHAAPPPDRDLDEVKDKIDDVEKKVDDLQKKLDDVWEATAGDPKGLFMHYGTAEQSIRKTVEEMKDQMEEVEGKIDKLRK